MIGSLAGIVWWLLVGHLAGDYLLQSDTIASNKNPWAGTDLQKQVPWYYWMGAHAAMHGAVVTLVLGSVGLGVAETAAHFLIDLGKCRRWYGIHVDQLLHLLCKALWLAVVWF